MKSYDIGILTFWNVPNYGTFAQAYALQKVIQSININCNVRQIAHLDKHHYNFYYNIQAYHRKNKIWKKNFWESFFIKNVSCTERKKVFIEAYNKIPHTENVNSKRKKIRFNKVFLGSDIIWDFSLAPFNHDRMLFGEGLDSEINSYAASFGTINLENTLPEYVEHNIRKMKHISVRDEKSACIVQRITGIKPVIVLDPVWMWNFNTDPAIKVPKDKDYVLVYGQDFTPEFIENLIIYSRNNNLKIIALDCNNDHYEWCDELISQENLDPFSWIGYFKGASSIATSTFHGLTFGLVFNKKIAYCKSDFIMEKIDTFLKELDLYDLIMDKNNVDKMLSYDWNYYNINKIIDKKKKDSFEFLKKACKTNGGE